ncbi:Vacuolar protein sorting-associated protein 18 homolog [Strongyloides ratti]|uniref:Vacuolar protein sorting-associated protein 18 homolog n=1 Tax=Strongyloides ratti TaxID=34506 RepID=A0A090LK11_STRRB|nr:Vacuolar protein sorting-associated protein 18 homolog [Strongyloides ratti]CEF68478.1 Vacuolar protein sorting-associated protein 18 homolog [Strongyloides ratti]
MSNPFEDDIDNNESLVNDQNSSNEGYYENKNLHIIQSSPMDSFEQILLEKLQNCNNVDKRQELIEFLENKLESIKNQNEDNEKIFVQKAVLILYLVNLKTKQILDAACENDDKVKICLNNLENFINNSEVVNVIRENKNAVMKMMEDNACLEGKLMLAKMLKDRETIIDTYIRMELFSEAFSYLLSHYEFMYFRKYMNYFIDKIPEKLVESLCNEPVFKNLPSAVYQKIVFELAEFESKKITCSKEINNLWIALTAQDDPSLLYPFLKKKLESFSGKIDINFALSVVNNNKNLYKCQALLNCALGLWDKAVSISLEANDFSYAKECVMKMVEAGNDDPLDELKKEQFLFGETQKLELGKPTKADQNRVWRILTNYVLEHDDSQTALKKCLSFIKDSNGCLKFEEILALFPSISCISDIKEPLRDCLDSYRRKQKKISCAMVKAEEANSNISKYLNKLKKCPIIVRPQDKCLKCKEKAMSKPFYVFNCKHIFHDNCFEEMVSHEWKNNEIRDNYDTKDNLKFSSISQHCPLCGLDVIEGITKPLFSPVDYLEELRSWKIDTVGLITILYMINIIFLKYRMSFTMLCMRDLQKAVEDVMIKPEQNRLEDIRQRSTLTALDLCEPTSSNNNKNIIINNVVCDNNHKTLNNLHSWEKGNLVMGLTDLPLSIGNTYLPYNSIDFNMPSNNTEIYKNNESILNQPHSNNISCHTQMYNSFEQLLLRSSSSIQSSNTTPYHIKITNPNINELSIDGLIESRKKRSNSVSSCCPIKNFKFNINTFNDISESNSNQLYDSLEIPNTSIDGFNLTTNEYNENNEDMDIE